MSFKHEGLLEYVSKEMYEGMSYSTLSEEQKLLVDKEQEERYIAYIFLRQSGKQHGKLQGDLKDDFTTGEQKYPTTRQQTLHLLDKYTKSVVKKPSESEGTAFAQKSGKEDTYDKKYWKDKKCYNCDKTGHPSSHCPEKDKKEKAKKKEKSKSDDDDASSKSTASSVKKLNSEMKKMQKKYESVNTQLKALKEAESDISDSEEETSHFQYENETYGFTQVDDCMIKIQNLFKQSQVKINSKHLDLTTVILLDSQSTMDLFCNRDIVTNVRPTKTSMVLKSNGGTMKIKQKATMPGYNQDVWFDERAITNIIALKNLTKQYRVTYDSLDSKFVVHRPHKTSMAFEMHSSGLHIYQPKHNEDFAFVETVEENKHGLTKRQITGAKAARQLYSALQYPSIKDFKWIVQSNQIKDCPVTVADIEAANQIWGKDIAALKGKTIRTRPVPVVADFVKVPKELLSLHREVFLTVDIFFVNQIPFFLTLSRKICFTSVNHLANRKTATVFAAFRDMYQFYMQRGFRITTVHADGEFQALKQLIESLPGGPTVNLAASNEHVPEIERRIRVVKERCRATRHSLPFKTIPKLLTIHIVFQAVKLLNFFPQHGGISDNLSPKTILTGETLDFKIHLNLLVGQYCQVHEEEAPRNSETARTQGALSLGPSGNIQGGYKFLSLQTGKKITRRSWDVIPISSEIIAHVEKMSTDEPENMTFTDRHGTQLSDQHNDDQMKGVDEIPGVESPHTDIIQSDEPSDHDIIVDSNDNDEITGVPTDPHESVENDQTDQNIPDPDIPVEPAPAQQQADPAAIAPRRSARIRTQPKAYTPSLSSGSRYAYAAAQLESTGALYPDSHMFVQTAFYQADPDLVAIIMTQLSLKAGLKEWGEKAYKSAYSEMKQLHFRNTFKPKHWRELTPEQRMTVLESHMFLKKKRCGDIKGRTVAGGNKQRDYISKEDASSPTVATESVLLTCIVDAEERRETAIVDIPNAFIQTKIEDEKDMAYIKIRGVLVDILVDIAPSVYTEYVTKDNKGNKQLLVQCLNALYGTMVASLLYYKKFARSLKEIGFVFNPYDPCVANKTIEGEQMTICFHVDDCKISHRSKKCVDEMIAWLRKEYESIFEDGSGKMTVSRGKVHDYLGMKLDYSTEGQVKISMFAYIDEIIAAFDKAEPKGGGTKNTAAPDNLFRIDPMAEKLNQTQAIEFHNLVAKTLYATKRARPDTCTAIAFLTTRVREPDKDDWKKLVHLMRYLRGTRDLPLVLSADGSGILKWWVDAAFAVHPNMRGHSGGGLSLGRGFPIVTSTKQKLNAKSSTEAEIIGADDFMPAICWTRYFMLAQGYDVLDNVLFQDNKSAMLLEKNGKASSSKRTKHIHIRYFFITDRIAQGELSVGWCPTGDMIGDFMTKPLQGVLFTKFRNQIMGLVSAKLPTTTETKSGDSAKETKVKHLAKHKGKKESLVQHVEGKSKLHHRSVLGKVAKGEEAKKRTTDRTINDRQRRASKNG